MVSELGGPPITHNGLETDKPVAQDSLLNCNLEMFFLEGGQEPTTNPHINLGHVGETHLSTVNSCLVDTLLLWTLLITDQIQIPSESYSILFPVLHLKVVF